MITISLIGAGGFLVTVFSYILGAFKVLTNLPAVTSMLKDFFS